MDACLFERLNVDGCAFGAYFAPKAAYYVRLRSWVAADNPYYGLYVNGENRRNRRMEISQIQFIRSGGAFEEGDGLTHAAVCLDHVNTCIFRDNLIDDAGVFWYFRPDAVSNSAHETRIFPTVSLHVRGDENILQGNVISGSHAAAIVLNGNGNVLMNNVADGDVIIEGNGNTVCCLVFTRPDARLIIRGQGNQVLGTAQERISISRA